MRRRTVVLALTAVLGCGLSAPAFGMTVVGQTLTPTTGCPPNSITIQTGVAAGNGYEVPSAGVLTAWRHEAVLGEQKLRLKVVRPAGVDAYTTVAQSGLATTTGPGLHRFPTRIPVAAGDLVAFGAGPSDFPVPCSAVTAEDADTQTANPVDPPIGSTANYPTPYSGNRLDLAAELEADADGDGFGDETQDGCPGTAGPQNGCPAQVPTPPCPTGTSPGVTCQTVAGVTTIRGTPGSDRIVGTPGRDVVLCGDGADTVTTGAGDDEVRCGAGADRVDTGLGNDAVFGELGNDKLLGGPGTDRLSGGDDQDRLGGGSGKDTASGGNGRDVIGGGSGSDRLNGGAGADRVSGDSGNDSVKGASGNDRLFGGSGRDRLSGGSGRDRLAGGTGRDRLSGGPGTDKTRQ